MRKFRTAGLNHFEFFHFTLKIFHYIYLAATLSCRLKILVVTASVFLIIATFEKIHASNTDTDTFSCYKNKCNKSSFCICNPKQTGFNASHCFYEQDKRKCSIQCLLYYLTCMCALTFVLYIYVLFIVLYFEINSKQK